MTLTRLTLNTTVANVDALSHDLHLLMQQTLDIPPEERLILIDENPESFFSPTDQPGPFALLEITLNQELETQTRDNLFRQATVLLTHHGIPSSNRRILLRHIPLENWA